MKLITDYVGEIEYEKNEVIHFPEGVFGFEDSKNFIIVGEIVKEFPFVWLQSIDEAHVVFVLTNPFLFVENYDFELAERDLKTLKTDKIGDINVYTTVVIPAESKKATINLKSPIVINTDKMIGLQAILDEDYPYKHPLFK